MMFQVPGESEGKSRLDALAKEAAVQYKSQPEGGCIWLDMGVRGELVIVHNHPKQASHVSACPCEGKA